MENDPSTLFLEGIKNRFLSYKFLGDKSIEFLDDAALHWSSDNVSNSMAILIQHLSGNMISRFSDFLHTDGEKDWRNREGEFIDGALSRKELLHLWESGWACLLKAILELKEDDLTQTVFIRGEPLSVMDALLRQLSHYAYHVGQMVYIAKTQKGISWKSLSIPKANPEDRPK